MVSERDGVGWVERDGVRSDLVVLAHVDAHDVLGVVQLGRGLRHNLKTAGVGARR